MVTRRAILATLAAATTAGCSVIASEETTRTERFPAVESCDQPAEWPRFQHTTRRRGHLPEIDRANLDSEFRPVDAFPVGGTARIVCTREYAIVTWEDAKRVYRCHFETGAVDSLVLDGKTDVYPALHCSKLLVPTIEKRYWIRVGDLVIADEYRTARPHTAPLVDDDIMYIQAGGDLQAQSAGDGNRWSHPFTPTGIASSDSQVFAVEQTDAGGRLVAFDAASGARNWQTDAIGETYTDPVIGTHVYVLNNDGTVFAFDREDGTRQWAHETGTTARRFSIPAARDGTVYVPDIGTGCLQALDATDGSTQWETPIYADPDRGNRTTTLFAPVVSPETVFVSGGAAGIVALDRTTGEAIWQDAAHSVTSPLALAGDALVGAGPSGIVSVQV